MNRSATAFVFPGQGAQIVGMGADFAREYAPARAIFERADALLGYGLSALCFSGPDEALNATAVTQPALYVCGVAMLRALEAEHPGLTPACAAGHSLGEFTALTAAGALDFDDGLRLVAERARLMGEAGAAHPGGMAAVLGMEVEALAEVCARASDQTGEPLVVANDNCPGQVVISGGLKALDAGLELAKAAGAKRAVKLAVSVAAHSPLMAPASEALNRSIAATTFHPPRCPVYANVTAAPLTTVEAIRDELARQLTQPVRWTATIQAMRAAGVGRFIEIGPRDVLTGLLKRIDREAAGAALNSVEALRGLAVD